MTDRCRTRVRQGRMGFRLVFMVAAGLNIGSDWVLADERGNELEEIVVTARKRQEDLQSIPLSVNTLSSGQIADAVKAALSTDVTILVLGEGQNMVGEMASSSSLALPGRQQGLLDAVVATGKPVVVLLMNGRPLDLKDTKARAILDIWYPGSLGAVATANLLFGDAVPGGKLPFTWPRNASVGSPRFSASPARLNEEWAIVSVCRQRSGSSACFTPSSCSNFTSRSAAVTSRSVSARRAAISASRRACWS